jgi:hypothetical protein
MKSVPNCHQRLHEMPAELLKGQAFKVQKDDNRSAGQYIPHLLWNTKVHYRVHKNPPLVRIVRLMNPIHTSPSYFPKINV